MARIQVEGFPDFTGDPGVLLARLDEQMWKLPFGKVEDPRQQAYLMGLAKLSPHPFPDVEHVGIHAPSRGRRAFYLMRRNDVMTPISLKRCVYKEEPGPLMHFFWSSRSPLSTCGVSEQKSKRQGKRWVNCPECLVKMHAEGKAYDGQRVIIGSDGSPSDDFFGLLDCIDAKLILHFGGQNGDLAKRHGRSMGIPCIEYKVGALSRWDPKGARSKLNHCLTMGKPDVSISFSPYGSIVKGVESHTLERLPESYLCYAYPGLIDYKAHPYASWMSTDRLAYWARHVVYLNNYNGQHDMSAQSSWGGQDMFQDLAEQAAEVTDEMKPLFKPLFNVGKRSTYGVIPMGGGMDDMAVGQYDDEGEMLYFRLVEKNYGYIRRTIYGEHLIPIYTAS